MRRLVLPLGLAALWLSPFFVQAQPETALTLDRAQALAASHSFSLAAAQREREAAEAAWRQAGARPNPVFNASVEDTRHATRTTTATVDVPIELGGKRAARLAAAERARELAAAEFGQAEAQLRADVVAAFHAVLMAQERVRLTADSAALAARGADVIARRVAAGKLSPVDGTRASVDRATAQLEADEAAMALQAARQALAALWGEAEPAFPLALGEVETVPERPAVAELAPALEASPGLLAQRIEIDRRQALIGIERSKRTGDLSLSVGAKRDNELGLTQAIVGIAIPLPWFDRNQGAIDEATRRAEKAGDEYQAARLRLRGELQQASSQLAVARASASTLKSTVLPAAQQAYEAATTGFEAGKFGFLDVIDAQRALLQARARHLAALAQAHQAASAIDRVLGR